jgi:uncharacterized protein GlcG (DUF336 family)
MRLGAFLVLSSALAGIVPANAQPPILTAEDVQSVVEKAAASISLRSAVIAVTDRQGNILGLYRKPDAPATYLGNFGQQVDANDLAIALARTASFFSNNQAPLSSRTVRYISGVHFPPGIRFTPVAALYGIENTNRGCPLNADFIPGQEVPPARSLDGSQVGLGIQTGKANLDDSDADAVNPGGVPLFKNGAIVGGVGVTGVPPDVAEYAAFSAAAGAGFGPTPAPPGVVIIDGIALPFVNQTTAPAGVNPGVVEGGWIVQFHGSPGPAPEGDLIAPHDGAIGGLTKEEVRKILDAAVAGGNQIRAVIRLPLGSRARFVIAVTDLDGTLIGLHRMPDATIFSIDVAVAKARNMIYFAGPDRKSGELTGVPLNTAITNRSIAFGSQPFYPPGIDFSAPGPFFDLYKFDTLNPCTQGQQAANPNQSGIVFFPGSVPLYRNGKLVGGLGVSGDGVEQDDLDTSMAAVGFEAVPATRADRLIVQGVRLPYLKFPRNPLD